MHTHSLALDGNTIGWTSYNLPSTITAAGQSSQFAYGPNRNRWRQIASYPSGTETTIYVGGILEKVTVPSGTAYRHYIGAGSASVLYTRWTTGTIHTKYVTADHLGSSTVVMDSAGGSLVNLSFGSYGARRGSNWTGTPSAGDWTQIGNSTRHGFTGHEALDNVNFVHMNGRVFEPVLGRFLSADPFMPGILGSQAPNRYAYVGNRPHSLTDPSGFYPDGDVTETDQPVPRRLPQCPYQIANIAVDCDYRYGWRWDRDPFELWLLDEYRVEAWVRAMMAGAASGTNRPPPTRPAPPAPRPGPVPADPDRPADVPRKSGSTLSLTCTVGPMGVAAESKIGLFGEAKIRTPIGGIHLLLDVGSANQSTNGEDYFSQGAKISFQVHKWEIGLGYERESPLGTRGGPVWSPGRPLIGWEELELSKEGLTASIGGGLFIGASGEITTGPVDCQLDR